LIDELINECKGIIPFNDLKIAKEYNEHKEWGVAVEHLYFTISELGLTVNERIFEQFRKCIWSMPGFGDNILKSLLNDHVSMAITAQQGDAPEPDLCRSCLSETTSRPGDL
jgi:hypothetical protein